MLIKHIINEIFILYQITSNGSPRAFCGIKGSEISKLVISQVFDLACKLFYYKANQRLDALHQELRTINTS
jgi:hypothetical protein